MTTAENDHMGREDASTNHDELHRKDTLTSKVEQRARRTLDDVAQKAGHFEQAIGENAAEARERLRAAKDDLETSVDENMEKVKQYVRANPLTSAGIAFAVGFIFSRMFRK